jgi:hypothetical protein
MTEGKLERVKGIEPSYSAWKAAALPLSYTRTALPAPALIWHSRPQKATAFRAMLASGAAVVEGVGFEPT